MKLVPAALCTAAFLAAGTAMADDCRPVDAPPGVRVPATPGCLPADRAKPARVERLRASRDPGFIDLGQGTTVRVGGRVRVETGIAR